MAKKSVGFFDQHVEKIVIGLCGLGLAAAAYLAFSGARFSVDNRGPSELAKAVADATESARTSVLSPKSSGPEPKSGETGDPTLALKGWFGDSAKGLAAIAQVADPLPRTQPFPPLLPFTSESMKAEKRNLAKLPPPGPPIVLTGRSTLNFPVSKPMVGSGQEPQVEDIKPAGSTVSWVSVGSQVDLVDQQASFIAERYPPRSYYTIVKVHLQRKDESDPGKGWVDVHAYLPFEEMNKPLTPDGRINMSDVRKYRRAYDFDAEAVCRPSLPPRISGDRIELVPLPFMDESPKGGLQEPGKPPPESADSRAGRLVRKWTDMAKSALVAKRPFKQKDVDGALVLARAAVGIQGAKDKEVEAAKKVLDEVEKQLPKSRKEFAARPNHPADRLMPIVAHDLSAIPGHTYVYRMRYEVYNLYAGNTSDLLNPAEAEKLTLFSDWSLESRPTEIPSDVYFYLTKADKASSRATVTVLKKTAKGMSKKEYTIEAGEKIGKKELTGQKLDFSTGAVCVALDFDRSVEGKKDVSLVYADPTNGALYERLLSKDANDPIFKRLSETPPPKP